MKCIFCHEDLNDTDYYRSKPIPKEKNHFFIVCRNCNVVMKAKIKNNKIKKIEEAPMHDLVLAADLFKLNDHKVEGFKLNHKNNLSKYIYDDKTLT